ncbi:hypothetical protein BVX97_00160 [bacterium E08(2017)]|nr:hypothetical protein BVX97_00160 [bacterium E08(2017)]
MKKKYRLREGFTLMEVNIAVAMVSVGLLAVFALFPLGLRESSLSVADNHEAMFANHVLSCVQANAMHITDWSVWSDDASFAFNATRDVDFLGSIAGNTVSDTAIDAGVDYPSGDPAGNKMRYELKFLSPNGGAPSAGQKTYMIQIKCRSDRYGDFNTFASTYVTYVTFLGE